MEAEAVNCPKCGGPLQFEHENAIVLCVYCGSRVIVKETRSGKIKVSLGKEADDLVTEQAFLHTLEKQLIRLNGDKHQMGKEKERLLEAKAAAERARAAAAVTPATSASSVGFDSRSFLWGLGITFVLAIFMSIVARGFGWFIGIFMLGSLAACVAAAVVGSQKRAAEDKARPAPPPAVVVNEPDPLIALAKKESELLQQINLVHKTINETNKNIDVLSHTIVKAKKTKK